MNRTHLRRSLVAVTTVVVGLVAVAGPAAAATHDADVTGGVITLYGTGSVVKDAYDLAPVVPPCGTSTLELDVTTTGTIGVTGLQSKTVANHPVATGNPFLRVLTYIPQGTAYGTLTGAGPYTITDMRVIVEMTSYSSGDYSGCVPGPGSGTCTIAFLLELDGTLTGTTPTSTVSLTGGTAFSTASLGCLTGFGLVGTTAVVTTPITATLTT